MKRVLLLMLILTFVMGPALAEQNGYEPVYSTFVSLCGMYDITVNDTGFEESADGAKTSLSTDIADGAVFCAYYDAGKLTGYELSLIGDSYAGEKIAEMSILFVMSVDRTRDLSAAENILNNLSATAFEDENLPGLTRCSYSTDAHNYSLTAIMGDYILSIKPI